jgi:predicted ArsR family transcriptional regulator
MAGAGSGRAAPEPFAAARRVQLLEALHRRGPSTVGDLAAEVGLHENSTREHLRVLVDAGYAARDAGVPAGRGRPRMRYRAVRPLPQPATSAPGAAAVAQAALARALLDGYGTAPQDVAESARRHGFRAGAALPNVVDMPDVPVRAADDDGEPQVRALGSHLERMGFEPRLAPDGSAYHLRRCPFLDLARARPDVVCQVHLGLAQAVLARAGGPVRAEAIVPFASPGVCVLRLAGTAAPGPVAPSARPGSLGPISTVEPVEN